MRKGVVFFVWLMMLSCSFTFASEGGGSETGNGGDVFVCRNAEAEIERIGLIDFFEAEILFDYHVDPSFEGLEMEEIVERIIARIGRHLPVTAIQYQEQWEKFFEEARIVDVELEDIPDSNHPFVPIGCEIEQIAIQRSSFPRYLISEPLWEELDAVNRAGLIMHEIIYRDAIERGHQDSIVSRELNAWLASVEFLSVSTDEFITRLDEMGFFRMDPRRRYPNLLLNIEERQHYFLNGMLKCVEIRKNEPSYILLKGVNFQITKPKHYISEHVWDGIPAKICFFPNGAIKSFRGIAAFWYEIQGRRVKIKEVQGLYENGEFIHFVFENAEFFQVGGKKLKFKSISLDKKYRDIVLEGVLAKEHRFVVNQGEIIAKKGSWVQFSSDGSPKIITDYHGNVTIKSFSHSVSTAVGSTALIFHSTGNRNIYQVGFQDEGSAAFVKINGVEYQLRGSIPGKTRWTRFFSNGSFRSGTFRKEFPVIIDNRSYRSDPQYGIDFYESGKIKSVILKENSEFSMANVDEEVLCRRLELYENGALKSCSLMNRSESRRYVIRFQGRQILAYSPFVFSPSGEVISANVKEDILQTEFLGQPIEVKNSFIIDMNKEEHFNANTRGIVSVVMQSKQIRFGSLDTFNWLEFKDGRVVKAILAEDTELKVLQGTKKFQKGEFVCFDKNGLAGKPDRHYYGKSQNKEFSYSGSCYL